MAGLAPAMRDGIALALRPSARHVLAEGRKRGLSAGQVQRDVLAALAANRGKVIP
jgi:hypothetical protein